MSDADPENVPAPDRSEDASSDLTRREWLLRLGEATALVGAAGLAPNEVRALTVAQTPAAAVLPPGLYEPSPAHLLHTLATGGPIVVPPGSETDYAVPRRGPYRARLFSGDEFAIVTRIVEILLGQVDRGALAEAAEWVDLRLAASRDVRRAARALDPLHRSLAVAYYGERRVVDLETADPQGVLRDGLRALDADARRRFGRTFIQATGPEQTNLVGDMSRAYEDSSLRRCYDLVRREAIRGYYTSQAGLKDLDYKGNAVYGVCPGCDTRAG